MFSQSSAGGYPFTPVLEIHPTGGSLVSFFFFFQVTGFGTRERSSVLCCASDDPLLFESVSNI
jgi:hypothetical protein